MSIQIRCPICRDNLAAPDNCGGKKVRCPNCQSVLQVPTVSTVLEPPTPANPATMDYAKRTRTAVQPPPDRGPSVLSSDRADEGWGPATTRRSAKAWLIGGCAAGLLVSAVAILVWFSLDSSETEQDPEIKRLIAMIDDPNPKFRVQAAEELGKKGEKARGAIPKLVAVFRRDVATRRAASVALVTIATGFLRNPRDRLEGVTILGELGSEACGAVPLLIPFLEDAKVAVAVESSLEKIGPPKKEHYEAVIEYLKDKSPRVRLYVARTIPKMVEERPKAATINALITALKDEDADVCREAVTALPKVGSDFRDRVVPALFDSVAKPGLIGANAREGLKRLGVTAKDPTDFSVIRETLLHHESQRVRLFAMEVLATEEISKQIVVILREALKDPETIIREQVTERLGKAASPDAVRIAFGALLGSLREKNCSILLTLSSLKGLGKPPAAEMRNLAKCLDHSSLDVRLYAVQSLGAIGSEANWAAYRLQETASDPKMTETIRRESILSLGKIGLAPRSVETLLALAADPTLGQDALKTLRQVCPVEKMDVAQLELLIKNKNLTKEVRGAAVDILGGLKKKARSVASTIQSIVAKESDSPDLCVKAILTLGNIGPAENSVAVLIDALPNAGLREKAFEALKKVVEPTKEEDISALASLIQRNDLEQQVREYAVKTLGQVKASKFAKGIKEVAEKDGNLKLRQQAVEALANIGRPAVSIEALVHIALDYPELGETVLGSLEEMRPFTNADASAFALFLAKSGQAGERSFAARQLGDVKGDRALRALRERLRRESEPAVRNELVTALGKLGPAAIPAIPELVAMLERGPWQKTKEAKKKLDADLKKRDGAKSEASRLLYQQAVDFAERRYAAALAEDVAANGAIITLFVGSVSMMGKDAVESLRNALNNDSPVVREAARKAIREIRKR